MMTDNVAKRVLTPLEREILAMWHWLTSTMPDRKISGGRHVTLTSKTSTRLSFLVIDALGRVLMLFEVSPLGLVFDSITVVADPSCMSEKDHKCQSVLDPKQLGNLDGVRAQYGLASHLMIHMFSFQMVNSLLCTSSLPLIGIFGTCLTVKLFVSTPSMVPFHLFIAYIMRDKTYDRQYFYLRYLGSVTPGWLYGTLKKNGYRPNIITVLDLSSGRPKKVASMIKVWNKLSSDCPNRSITILL